jgi:VCBS repeat-containing protein
MTAHCAKGLISMDKPQAKNLSRNVIRKAKPAQSPSSASRVGAAVRSTLMALEPRMLFDGAAGATVDAVVRHSEPAVDHSAWSDALPDAAGAFSAPTTGPVTTLLVVDQQVQNWQSLVADVAPGTQVLVLDSNQDGVQQIARAVSGMTGLQSIQVLSHGAAGSVALGNAMLDTASLQNYAGELTSIGQSLSDNGDILLYGCDVGSGAAGATFLQTLARATNADVAASLNDTGARALGGDWQLEAQVGTVEVASSIGATQQGQYADLLDGLIVNNNPGNPGTAVISGHLYDASGTPSVYNTNVLALDRSNNLENCFANVEVCLVWAGLDGNFQTAMGATTAAGDDMIFRVRTGSLPDNGSNPQRDTFGVFEFSGLAAGSYRICVPTALNDSRSLDVVIANDADITGAQRDGVIELNNVVANAVIEDQLFRYVQVNQAPIVSVPGPQTVANNTQLIFDASKLIALADNPNDPTEYVNAANNYCATISVNNGILGFSPVAGVNATGELSSRLVLTGSLANLNNAIQGLLYTANSNFTGTDTMTVRLDDKGNVGDANGDGKPGDVVLDNLSDSKTIAINVTQGFVPPVALNDTNALCWSQAPITGSVRANDTDADNPTADLVVCGVAAGTPAGVPNANVGTTLPGSFGRVVINADGTYQYTVDLTNAQVIALANAGASGTPLIDTFTYCIRDPQGNESKATLTITVNPNAVPVGVADANNIVVGTSTAASGNVLTNDSDPDGNRALLRVCGVGDVNATLSAPDPTYPAAGRSVAGAGGYGSVVIDSTGNYVFTLNAGAAATISAGTSVTETFQYCVIDDCGGCSKTNLVITISAPAPVNVAPVANPDAFNFCVGQTPPTGSVLANDTDANGDLLSVCGVAAGNPTAAPAGGVGVAVNSANGYGALTVNANGTYNYVLNTSNPTVAALTPSSAPLSDVFTYCVTDGHGNQSRTTVTITICPPNNAVPVAQPDKVCIPADTSAPITGNVVSGVGANSADTDGNGDNLVVQGVVTGSTNGVITGGVGGTLTGQYGTVTIAPNGSFTYTLNPNTPALLAAKPGDPQLNDVFTYTINDGRGATATSTLTICIDGVNDCPIPANDANTVSAASGSNTGGNVLGGPGASAGDKADVDPDGDKLTVCGVVGGAQATAPNAGVGTPIMGQYGSLVLNADGSYTYTIDATKPAVAALKPGQTLSDTFTYCVTDGTCAPQAGRLVVTVTGVNKPPVATGRPDMTTENGDIKCDLIGVSDPDNANPDLRITIDSISNPNSGVFFLREPIAGQPGQFRETIVMPGMQITGDQAQYLCFRPNPAANAPRGPDGALLPPTLTFTVRDPDGSTATAATTITIKPPVRPLPPIVPPVIQPPPVTTEAPPIVVLPALTPPPIRPLAPTSFVPVDIAPALDPVTLFEPQPFNANEKALDVPTVKSTAVEAKPVAVKAEADCVPVKPKIKPKAVKRAVFTDAKPAAKFSEQLKVAKQRFKLPPKVAPKPALGKDC